MAYKNAELKHKVYQARNAGKKRLVLKISDQQAEFLRKLGFKVKPYLYRIKTKTWKNVDDVQGILKELHFLRKKGVGRCVKQLKDIDLKLLDEYHVEYEIAKYLIILKEPQKSVISTT